LISMEQHTQSLVLKDHLLACQWQDEDWHNNEWITRGGKVLDFHIGDRTVNERYIPLPPDTALQEMVISPQGDRIAWHLSTKTQGVWVESLWVSRIDGTQMHEIGSGDLEGGKKPQIISGNMKWVPGEKRLSFRDQHTLYTVPVE
jgi:hypothetical protein